MMSPSLIECEDGRRVVLGSGGSNRIRTALLQVLINLIDFRMDIEPAVVAPRVHFENDLLSLEGGIDADQLTELLRSYPEHRLWDGLNLFFGGTHLAAFDGDRFQGVGDPRRGGVAGAPLLISLEDGRGGIRHLAALPAEPSEAPPEGRVHWRRTPAGAAVRVVHRGAYAKLPETHAKLAAWLAVHGLEPGGASWEQYVSNPAETPPSERVTHVYALLAPGTEEPSPAGIESD